MQSSTQHPSETQEIVAHVLGLASHEVTVQCLRMGGGFGGKEMQPHGFAAIAALGATLTGRPVRLRLNRTQDMTMSGKRHGFHGAWRVGFDDDGTLQALDADADRRRRLEPRPVRAGAGARDVPHRQRLLDPERPRRGPDRQDQQDVADGVPRLRRAAGDARRSRTCSAAARRCSGIDALELRRRNFYRSGDRHAVRAAGAARGAARRRAGAGARTRATSLRRTRRDRSASTRRTSTSSAALAITPVKFGISFNLTAFNQAGALVHVYKDGSVLINHGGTEMGQGLHTKMLQVAATTLGVPLARVRLAPTRTDKVPNTSATAASSGADLNGAAIKNACEQIRERLAPVAGGKLGVGPQDVRIVDGVVSGLTRRQRRWDELVHAAYFQRVQLWAAGFYRTEGLHWDVDAMHGEPFKYFAYGVAAAEVEVDGFTGAYTLRRVDIVHDVGDSLSPLIDIGQIEGGFVQGAGWLTLEDLRWDEPTGPAAAGWPPRRRAPTSCRASRRCPRCSTSSCCSRRTRTARSTARRPSASRR